MAILQVYKLVLVHLVPISQRRKDHISFIILLQEARLLQRWPSVAIRPNSDFLFTDYFRDRQTTEDGLLGTRPELSVT